MLRILNVAALLSVMLLLALAPVSAQDKNAPKNPAPDKAAAAAKATAKANDAPKQVEPPPAPPAVTQESLKGAVDSATKTGESVEKTVKGAVGLLLVVFVVGIASMWIVLANKIGNIEVPAAAPPPADLTPLATTAQLTTQLQPIATTAQLQAVQTALDARTEAIRVDVANMKGTIDAVVNLVGHLLPGNPQPPPQPAQPKPAGQ